MSHSSKEIPDINENESAMKVEEIFLFKQNMTIKTMIMDIEDSIADIKKGVNRNQKLKNTVSDEIKNLQDKSFQLINTTSQLIKEDLINFTNDLIKLRQTENQQSISMDNQIKEILENDKIINQKFDFLQKFVGKIEDSIGMDFYK